jgi:hypothetical protein
MDRTGQSPLRGRGHPPRRNQFVDTAKIKIRCPNCRKDGKARVEHINRRVSCKNCAHIFRAIPVDDNAPGSVREPESETEHGSGRGKDSTRKRIELLEAELKNLRTFLKDQSGRSGLGHGPSVDDKAAGEIAALREQLARAYDDVRRADERRRDAEAALTHERTKVQDAPHLREQLADAQRAAQEAERRRIAQEEAAAALERNLRTEIGTLQEQLDHTAHAGSPELRVAELEAQLAALREAQAAEHARLARVEHPRGEATDAIARHDADHAAALQALEAELEAAKARAEAAEQRLSEQDEQTIPAFGGQGSDHHFEEVRSLLEDVARLRAQLEEAESARVEAVEKLRQMSEEADHAATATIVDTPTLGGNPEVEALRAELARVTAAHRAIDDLRLERDREQDRVRGELLEQIDAVKAQLAAAEAIRVERDQAYDERDRLLEQVAALRTPRFDDDDDDEDGFEMHADDDDDDLGADHPAHSGRNHDIDAETPGSEWRLLSTETSLPISAPVAAGPSTILGDASTVAELQALREEARVLRDESRTLHEELDQLRPRLLILETDLAAAHAKARQVAEAYSQTDQSEYERIAAERKAAEALAAVESKHKAEVEQLNKALEEARHATEAAERSRDALATRISLLEAAPPPTVVVNGPTTGAIDPEAFEAERKRMVDEAVQGAWADFERRLAETHTRLKAANTRAELLEIEAREARQQVGLAQRGIESNDFSSFEESISITNLRIMNDRGSARLTAEEADARLAVARQLAVERKDKGRIAKVGEKAKGDLASKNFTLADTLIRGIEIEAGIDPGGWSIEGLKIFRPSTTIVASLTALRPAFDRVLRQGDHDAIKSTIREMRTILGDQAGLPEIRRPGRTPAVKRPIAEPDAVRLFIAALESEQWLMKPIEMKRPLPDTALTTYACLIEAGCDARAAALKHLPEKVDLIDKVIQASGAMLMRRQQADGHFPFLDPRGKASKLATMVDAMVGEKPDAVKDGWVIGIDPFGSAQSETSYCGIALARAGAVLGKNDMTQASLRAADWTLGQPCLSNFQANAFAISQLARAYLDARQDKHLGGMFVKLSLGLLPGQHEEGRWIDPTAAQTPHHVAILRALHDAVEALPHDREPLRTELVSSVQRAMRSLLEECAVLGVPPQGGALRELIRHRDLFQPDIDPRIHGAILDSATVIQELCHDGPKPKLGVTPDQLAALTRV